MSTKDTEHPSNEYVEVLQSIKDTLLEEILINLSRVDDPELELPKYRLAQRYLNREIHKLIVVNNLLDDIRESLQREHPRRMSLAREEYAHHRKLLLEKFLKPVPDPSWV